MKTRILLTALGTAVVLLGVALAAAAVMVFRDNGELRAESRSLRSDLQRTVLENQRLVQDRADATVQSAAHLKEVEMLKADLTDARADATGANADLARLTQQARIRTYLGTQYVGMGWLLPGQGATDPKTARPVREPVLVLDESARTSLLVYKTNVVEREVQRDTTINYNYPNPYWYWPSVVVSGSQPSYPGGTNTMPPRPRPVTEPPRVSPPTPGGPVQPPIRRSLPPPVGPRRPVPNNVQPFAAATQAADVPSR